MEIKIIELLKKNIIHNASDKIEDGLIYNAIFFVLSCSLNIITKLRYKRYNSSELRIVNFFGITFAGTGEGKDFVLNLTLKEFNKLDNHYSRMVKKKFDQVSCMFEDCGIDFKNPNYALPSGLFANIDGTPEGFQKIMQGMAYAEGFSLNVSHGEIGDIILNADMLSRVKEAWDSGVGRGKTIAGGGYFDVKDIPVNVFLYGTPYSIKSSHTKIEKMKSELINGFGRRSFLYFSRPKKIEKNDEKGLMSKEEKQELDSLVKELMKLNTSSDRVICINKEATELLDKYIDTLKEEYNNDIQNELKKSIATSFIKIERLACIIALADFAVEVEPKHMQVAIDFNESTKEAIFDISKGYQPHSLIFDYLSTREMSRVELIQEIPVLNSKNFSDYMSLAKEFAMHTDYIIKENNKAIKTYVAEPLLKTDLEKIIVSVALDGKSGERAIHFKPMKLPFFGSDKRSIESLTNSDVGSFCFSHFNGTDDAPNGHRKADCFIQGQNCIAIDVDYGLALKDVLILLQDYTYIIYTTKSHQKDDNGDRYRIILPTYKEFFVDAEQHKEVIKNACKLLGIENSDTSTRNVSRLWFSNMEAEIYKNVGKMFDITSCIPNTEPNRKMMRALEPLDTYELEARVQGVYAWLLDSTDIGNRNSNLFRAGKLLQDLGEQDIELHITRLNSMMSEPLKDREVNVIVKSVTKGVLK